MSLKISQKCVNMMWGTNYLFEIGRGDVAPRRMSIRIVQLKQIELIVKSSQTQKPNDCSSVSPTSGTSQRD